MKSYSQNGEDLAIFGYFNGYKGTLLDIGANNGTDMSNSRMLIESGWKAHLVEPSLAYFPLCELHKDNKNVDCWYAGISSSTGNKKFYEGADSLLSTINPELAELSRTKYTERNVEFVTYETFLSHANDPLFDFITIDAEGEDLNILMQINLSKTKCLCIEYGNHLDEIILFCFGSGMKELYRNGENIIFTR